MPSTNDETKIKNTSHARKCLDGLYLLWKCEEFCDIVLKIGTFEMKAHKIVFISSCPYFKTFFAQEEYFKNGKDIVNLPDEVDKDAFKAIVEYFYTGSLVFNKDIVEQILEIANKFAIKDVTSMYAEYLLDNINMHNCIKYYILGVTLDLENIECRAKFLAVKYFEAVSETPEFCELTQEMLIKLLMFAKTEISGMEIYNAIINWTKFDPYNRQSLSPDLLKLLHTDDVNPEFYVDYMEDDNLVQVNKRSWSILVDKLAHKLVIKPNLNVRPHYSENSVYITSRSLVEKSFFEFKICTNEFVQLIDRPNIDNFCIVSYKNGIYLTAGQIEGSNCQISYKYSIDTKEWSEMNLNFERHGAGACILHDKLFVVGGYNIDNNIFLKSCSSYDFNSELQISLPDMKEERDTPGLTTYNNSIYACCGFKGANSVNSIERYDPREGQWFDVCTVGVDLGYCSATTVEDYLYCSQLIGTNIQKIDFRTNISERVVVPVASKRNWITSQKGKLFRVYEAGLDEFDSDKNQWLTRKCTFNLNHPVVVSYN